MQSIYPMETYAYGTSKYLLSVKEEIKCNNIIKGCKKLWWCHKRKHNIIDKIDKIYLYAKDRYGAKYQILINKRESTGFKHFNDFKASI